MNDVIEVGGRKKERKTRGKAIEKRGLNERQGNDDCKEVEKQEGGEAG